MPNKYVPLDYSDDIDEGIFNYTIIGNTVFRPKARWSDRDRKGIITYDHSKNNEELVKGLKIGKSVDLHTTCAIKNLVIKILGLLL